MGIGSSFLPSDILAAYLYAQLENIEQIQIKRKLLWERYNELLKPFSEELKFETPNIPSYATNNAHMFYLQCNNIQVRTQLIDHLKKSQINAVFHYLSLHKSPYYLSKHDKRDLPNSDLYSDCLLRLPMFYELTKEQVKFVCDEITNFYLHH